MLNLKTPGVYIQEISKLPASVAPVATAIPAFVGYTEKRGEGFPVNTPTRITSLLEYEEIFGGPYDENYKLTLTDAVGGGVDIAVDTSSPSPYLMYNSLQMYHANGGGPCYIVSVGSYDFTVPRPADVIAISDLNDGIDALKQEDEPTLLVVPEAVKLGTNDRKSIHNKLLMQCDELQDRFALMDALAELSTVKLDGEAFRGEVGMEYLKYGAVYYPSLDTPIIRYYVDETVTITDSRSAPSFDNEALSVLQNGSSATPAAAKGTITVTNGFAKIKDKTITIDGNALQEGSDPSDAFEIGATAAATATNIMVAIDALGNVTASADGNVVTIVASAPGAAGNNITMDYNDTSGARLSGASLEGGSDGGDKPDLELYNSIKAKLDAIQMTLYPSSAMAGVYARVDRDRGVWKAPANVSVNLVKAPSVAVTADEQAGLNVDPTAGKSINVIRTFKGKGVLAWGARTLAGNDNEWRYIPVRRLYIFIEESVKKATEASVFESNDANTWIKLRGMIENFLTSLWRDGALAGASPADAFFVKVGLGETMSALDILEGRLKIEIGMAAVRPAEFIILRFSHKLQES